MIIFGFLFATLSFSIANASLNQTDTVIPVDSSSFIKTIDSNLTAKDSVKTGHKENKVLKNDNSCSCLIQSIITILASLLTVLGSLGIFYWQIKKDRKKEINRQNQVEKEKLEVLAKEQDKYWNYLLLVIDSIIENSVKQSEYCHEFSEKSKIISTKSAILGYAANYDLTRFLNSTDQKELLIHFSNKSVNKDESIVLFRELYKSLDFLKATIQNVIETNENFIENLNKLRQDYSIRFESFKEELVSIRKFIHDNSPQLNEDDKGIAEKIKDIFDTYFSVMSRAKKENKDDFNNVELHYELITGKLLLELKDKFHNSRFYPDLILRCKSVKFLFENLRMTTNNLVETFNEYSISLKKESEKLKELKLKITAHNKVHIA